MGQKSSEAYPHFGVWLGLGWGYWVACVGTQAVAGNPDIQPIASWAQIPLGTLGTQATTRLAAGTGGSREPPVPAGLT